MSRRLLLISTSTVFGTRYLEHAYGELRDVLAGVGRVLFVPFALKDHGSYAAKARDAFGEMGFALDSLHEAGDPRAAVAGAEAVFCGGGNTFRLLKTLYDLDLVVALRARALAGMPYTGASAGSNLACPTVRTTNDMPIVEPRSMAALGLVSFQINPHYLDPVPGSTHMGETRETRIREFHEENDDAGRRPARGGDPARRGGLGPAEGRGRRADLPPRPGASGGHARERDRPAPRLRRGATGRGYGSSGSARSLTRSAYGSSGGHRGDGSVWYQ